MEEVAETHAKALALTRLESEAPTGPSAAAERNSPNP
jgi:hypothetical protein